MIGAEDIYEVGAGDQIHVGRAQRTVVSSGKPPHHPPTTPPRPHPPTTQAPCMHGYVAGSAAGGSPALPQSKPSSLVTSPGPL